MMTTLALIACHGLIVQSGIPSGLPTPKGSLVMHSMPMSQWRFEGEIGDRIDANTVNWLLRTPDTNPGLLEMLQRRDRRLPYREPVPWLGEFPGKYLISAVQALRLDDSPELPMLLKQFVAALIAGQAEDGYLGPWPKDQRLLGHWDLWGHYHCMLGLLMWYDHTGDQAAFDCAVRAADCICTTYATGDRRPIDAKTPETNLAVLHVMGQMYRRTGTEIYRTLMQRIEEDMPKDGDWLRQGAKGMPYYKLPGRGTRWESLHTVQGIAELYRITGEKRYKDATVNLWKSIRDFDRHPSGAFSTHESAIGSVYEKGAIETCCCVAWEALTIDVLKLTGDSTVADELELTTWNQVLASQHPSGSWWTYDTPMDGVRIPSFHHINFQYRPGTPELNCCSVNAPRGLGMLSEWAIMEDDKGLAVNFYGPGTFNLRRADGKQVTITQKTGFPLDGRVSISVDAGKGNSLPIRFRIPAWSAKTTATLNGAPCQPAPVAGQYLTLARTWKNSDVLELTFDMAPRLWKGKDGRHGKTVVYRGPLLLAFDAQYNDIETPDIPKIDMESLKLTAEPTQQKRRPGFFPPMGLWSCTAKSGATVTLCDFASAGAHGTDYVTWLPTANVPPQAAELGTPAEGAVGQPGPVLFSWKAQPDQETHYTVLVAKDKAFSQVLVNKKNLTQNHLVVEEGLNIPGTYYWKVFTVSADGASENLNGPRTFRLDPASTAPFLFFGKDELVAASALDGNGDPRFGQCALQKDIQPAPDRFDAEGKAAAFNGSTSGLRYAIPFFPADDYSFEAWVCPKGSPKDAMQQVFSAWCKSMDDPLRVTIQKGKVSARIETSGKFTHTDAIPVNPGRWVHLAAVKTGDSLTLYVDGQPGKSAKAPKQVASTSTNIGVGFNPMHHGGEHFHGLIDDFAFRAKALTAEEVAAHYAKGKPAKK